MENELFDLKYHIADYIYPRLKLFKEKVDKGECESVPIFSEVESMSIKEQEKFWSNKLEEMIFPFEYYNNSDKFSEMDKDLIKYKLKIGLDTFSKYFEDLWI